MPPLERRHSSYLDSVGSSDQMPYSYINASSLGDQAYYEPQEQRDVRKDSVRRKSSNSRRRHIEQRDHPVPSSRLNDSPVSSRQGSAGGCHVDLVEFMTQFLCLGPPEEAVRRRKRRTNQKGSSTTSSSTKDKLKKKSSSSMKKSLQMQVLCPVARYPSDEGIRHHAGPSQPRRKTLVLGPNIAFRPVVDDRDDENVTARISDQ
ncbi:hypothetical protein ACA910_021875 [Epithemia clementina (nom. ined.)]